MRKAQKDKLEAKYRSLMAGLRGHDPKAREKFVSELSIYREAFLDFANIEYERKIRQMIAHYYPVFFKAVKRGFWTAYIERHTLKDSPKKNVDWILNYILSRPDAVISSPWLADLARMEWALAHASLNLPAKWSRSFCLPKLDARGVGCLRGYCLIRLKNYDIRTYPATTGFKGGGRKTNHFLTFRKKGEMASQFIKLPSLLKTSAAKMSAWLSKEFESY